MAARDIDEEGPPDLVDINDVVAESAEAAKSPKEEQRKRVPITIVTGYLGAGKTTLLNYILKEEHGKKIAAKRTNDIPVAVDIEKSLTVNKDGQQVEEWLELANGCICCSVRDTGVLAIESLMERQGTFDYILLETTGLADPGNIAPLFWVDDGLGSSIYLDGIVTLVDGKNVLHMLDEPAAQEVQESHDGHAMTIAHLQISHADVIILNKADLVTAAELEKVKERITSINGLAKIHVTDHSKIPSTEGTVLEIHAYDRLTDADFSLKGHSHIDPTISTLSFSFPPISPSQLTLIDSWLRSILWDRHLPSSSPSSLSSTPSSDSKALDFEIHRLKGILHLTDGGSVQIIQGVREVFEITDSPNTAPQASTSDVCKVVLIGRGLGEDSELWQGSLEHVLSSSDSS
ncbi:hypothetical protein AJ80_07727 [Polytolypa hystricis UAMH7299]|uniref:CobW/HypB/UreG nucleotide-binding domain-containing protein n=1 Tax=Polytolypa hystricis (strain UAMH7299) TaxID=1447883 RepID=A0A2B7XK11_POLH7|nr:hypothetical protein AJ80_07727 [Polytolypa hystricis UAMH7299]